MKPVIRSHERIDYKRCTKKWFWTWRVGLVSRETKFGALEFGTWIHSALETWYGTAGCVRNGTLAAHFNTVASAAIRAASNEGTPGYVLEMADELVILGNALTTAYELHYGCDELIDVIGTELPLEFDFGKAIHRLKPDLVYKDAHGDIWLMEHKTAAVIRTSHLVIDDQARPYVAMAERALRNQGIITNSQTLKGIVYNFIRKAFPDEREIDANGRALNRDGSISKRQPAPLFVRHPMILTGKAKLAALKRLRAETIRITRMTEQLQNRRIDPAKLPKTPHSSCPKLCQFFSMCVLEEQGCANLQEVQQSLFIRRDPYAYGADTTAVPLSFEIG